MKQYQKRAAETILARLNGGRSEARYQKQIVYSQGDSAGSVLYVQSGKVKVTVVSNAGKEAVVAILPPGSFCGEECLTGHTLRISTVKTLTECKLIRMEKASVIRALHDDPEFSELFTTYAQPHAGARRSLGQTLLPLDAAKSKAVR